MAGLDSGGGCARRIRSTRNGPGCSSRLPRHDPRAGNEIVDTFHMVTEIAVTAGDLPDALATARGSRGDDIAGGQPHMAASKPILPLVLEGRFDEAAGQAERDVGRLGAGGPPGRQLDGRPPCTAWSWRTGCAATRTAGAAWLRPDRPS